MPRLAAFFPHNSIGPPLQQYAKTQPAAHSAGEPSLWARHWEGKRVRWSSHTAAGSHRHSVECASGDCAQQWRRAREGPPRHRRVPLWWGIVSHSQCTMTDQLFTCALLVLLSQAGAAPPSPLSDALFLTMPNSVSNARLQSSSQFWAAAGVGTAALCSITDVFTACDCPVSSKDCHVCHKPLGRGDVKWGRAKHRHCAAVSTMQPSSQGPGRGRRNKKAGATAVFPSKRTRPASPDSLSVFPCAAAAPKVRKMHTPSPFLR